MFPSRDRIVHVDGAALTVPSSVLDPVLFRSGAWMARTVAARIAPGIRLLDLGCGSGVVGVLSQRAGAQVVAVDINRRAVKAARRNGIRDARHGDLFAPVRGERFDVVCFNPPYFRGRPHLKRYGRALYGGPNLEVIHRFVAALPEHLTVTGQALVVLSDRAPDAIAALAAGWTLVEEGVVTDALGSETLLLYQWKTPPR